MTRYNIVADYIINGKGCICLVYGGTTDKGKAEEIVNRIKNNPTPNDLYSLAGGKNVRVEETNERPWWFDGTN